MSERSKISCSEFADIQVATFQIAEIFFKDGEFDKIPNVMQRLVEEAKYPQGVVDTLTEYAVSGELWE